MQLTADTFTEISGLLRSDKAAGGVRERRRHPRVGVNARTTILIPAQLGAKPIPVTVRDVSAGGLGMLVGEPVLAVGEEFVLVFAQGRQMPRRNVLYRVVRVARPSAVLYLVGASIVRDVEGDALAPARPPAAPRPVPLSPTPAAAAPPRPSVGVLYLSPDAAPADADLEAVKAVQERLGKLVD